MGVLNTARDLLRSYGDWIVPVLVALLLSGWFLHCQRVQSAKEDVARMQGRIEHLQKQRAADSARAARLKETVEEQRARIATLDSAVVAVNRVTQRVIARENRRQDSLERVREEAITAAWDADSAFRAVGDTLLEAVRPELRPLVRKRTKLHLETVEAGRTVIETLRRQLDSKNTVIARQRVELDTLRTAYRALRTAYDTLEAAYAQEQKLNASLREELRITRHQRDRYEEALDASIFDIKGIIKSPVSHLAAAGAGIAVWEITR